MKRPDPHEQLRRLLDGMEALQSSGSRIATLDPNALMARLRSAMPVMGITRVANLTGLDRIGIPVVMVCRPNARSLAVSMGKGLDAGGAMVSGLLEATELYHAEHITVHLKLGCQAELQSNHQLIDVDRLPRLAGSAFGPHLAMLWIEGLNLLSGETRWVPFESVRTNFTLPPPPGSGCFDCSSNGLGAGTSLTEALHHSICEIIERDSTSLWNRLPPKERRNTGIDLDSVSDERCLMTLERFVTAGFETTVWETTSDLGIPSFFCLLSDLRDPTNHHGIGAAAHPSRSRALLKALIEAAQVRTTYISGARDDLSPEQYSDQGRAKKRRLAGRLKSEHNSVRDFDSVRDCETPSPLANTALILERLSGAGINEVVAIDLTKENIGIPVTRAVIPGLEGPDDHGAYVPGERARQIGLVA